jgi:hypothetical protein
MRTAFATAVAAALAPAALAQQFVYNAAALPANNEECGGIVIVDVDGDGDNDLVISNGDGYGGTTTALDAPQHLFLNNGAGVFVAAHAQLNIPQMNAQMVISEDFDLDGDMDLMFASNSTPSPSRLLLNNGSGTFTDVTATNMPALALRSFCVCAGDVDDDGDSDVVLNDGGTFGGIAAQSRLLLNNGSAVFTDVTATHLPADTYNSQDITLFDYDGDFDIDIAQSGKGGAGKSGRLWLNDGTGHFAIDSSLNAVGTGGTYEIDFADLDGDNDMDSLVQSISGFVEGWGRNLGPATAQTKTNFTGGPSADDNEMAGFDYDNDGDIDVFVGSLGASEAVYRNTGGVMTLVAGVIQAQADSTLDIAIGDLNGDCKYDLVTGQGESGNFTDKVYINNGAADSVAPVFMKTQMPGAIGAAGTKFHAHIRDAVHDDGEIYAGMTYTYTLFGVGQVSGGGTAFHQGGGMFRALVPTNADTKGVELVWTATDVCGNSAQSSVSIGQTGGYTNLGNALAGTNGLPALAGSGAVVGGGAIAFNYTNGLAGTVGDYVVGVAELNLPLFGGVLVPTLDLLIPFATNGSGAHTLNLVWPTGVPSGAAAILQGWTLDAGAAQGFAASNAVCAAQE